MGDKANLLSLSILMGGHPNYESHLGDESRKKSNVKM